MVYTKEVRLQVEHDPQQASCIGAYVLILYKAQDMAPSIARVF